jgi:hypothetical protein
MNLRQTKRRKSEEMEVELQFDVVVESPKKCNWEDIDANDYADPSMVSEYVTGR